ncbi:MAG: DUF1425 domain-containing protein [Marinobacter sp.]
MTRLIVTGLLVLVLAGCAAQPPGNERYEREELKVDPEVQFGLMVTELFRERLRQPSGDSLLQIAFAVEGRSDTRFGWRVNWFNASGMEVSGIGQGYREARVLPGQNRYFKATAPHPSVVSFQLHLREMR